MDARPSREHPVVDIATRGRKSGATRRIEIPMGYLPRSVVVVDK